MKGLDQHLLREYYYTNPANRMLCTGFGLSRLSHRASGPDITGVASDFPYVNVTLDSIRKCVFFNGGWQSAVGPGARFQLAGDNVAAIVEAGLAASSALSVDADSEAYVADVAMSEPGDLTSVSVSRVSASASAAPVAKRKRSRAKAIGKGADFAIMPGDKEKIKAAVAAKSQTRRSKEAEKRVAKLKHQTDILFSPMCTMKHCRKTPGCLYAAISDHALNWHEMNGICFDKVYAGFRPPRRLRNGAVRKEMSSKDLALTAVVKHLRENPFGQSSYKMTAQEKEDIEAATVVLHLLRMPLLIVGDDDNDSDGDGEDRVRAMHVPSYVPPGFGHKNFVKQKKGRRSLEVGYHLYYQSLV